LSVDGALLDRARTKGLDLSRKLEGALRDELSESSSETWRQENRAAIEDYNAQAAKSGVFSDMKRRF